MTFPNASSIVKIAPYRRKPNRTEGDILLTIGNIALIVNPPPD